MINIVINVIDFIFICEYKNIMLKFNIGFFYKVVYKNVIEKYIDFNILFR